MSISPFQMLPNDLFGGRSPTTLSNEIRAALWKGFNNKSKVLKRRCYGIYNLPRIYRRLFLDLEGYRLYAY